MARKEFQHHEAVSAAVPGEGGYSAAIAVKGLGAGGASNDHAPICAKRVPIEIAERYCPFPDNGATDVA